MLHKIIESVKERFGNRLLILGHHYQCEDVIAHADLIGDSFQLSKIAAERSVSSCSDRGSELEVIIFCGVHFMAETADILANSPLNISKRSGRRVDVVLPDLLAGCSMADMADYESVLSCWEQLSAAVDIDEIIPVTYVNSSAELKSFCGERGGISCTSGNAEAVLEWALSRGRRVLFFPDQHLGRNTAIKMGISMTEIADWHCKEAELGGNNVDVIRRSKILLWDGFCCVHQRFLPEHIDEIRDIIPDVRVIVHPECKREVVIKADESGSTAYILRRIMESPAGSSWAVGTEGRFVDRIAKQNRDKLVVNLAFQPSYCSTMGLITLENLADALVKIENGNLSNVIRVEEKVAQSALIALQRMLENV
ncbi:MAG: quinolinate synthase NadA [Planctomycetaceae bacterium]|jgi:quinolinate synthase|nr:quinolinate synthase NadA [Planctomycetaceae bacterium]